MSNVMSNAVGLIAGILFGGLLAAGRLHEYDTIHAMLRLDEPDVFLLMASAILISAPTLWFLEHRGVNTWSAGTLTLARVRPQRHHVKGGALFGVGWAMAGTCPAPALVMVSSGAVLGLVAVPGIFLGLMLHGRTSRRSTGQRVISPNSSPSVGRQDRLSGKITVDELPS